MSVINREDAIAKIKDIPYVQEHPNIGLLFEEWLKSLPDADAGWISVEKRLPEEHEWIGTKKFGTTISDEVYVTFENEKGERFCKYMTFQNGELSRCDKAFMEAWYKGSKPIAWMPFPKPYEPKEDK